MIVAGRSKIERTFANIVIIGGLIFSLNLFLLLLLSHYFAVGNFELLIAIINNFSSGEIEKVDYAPLIWIFLSIYFSGVVLGLLELIFLTRLTLPQKIWVKLMILLSRGEIEFQVKPGHLLCEIIVAYRIAGRRPLVMIEFANGNKITGECLKYCWDSGESMLLKDVDKPGNIVLVVLKDVLKVEFLNPVLGMVKETGELLSKQDRLFFDLAVWPGYSDNLRLLKK